VKTSTAIVVVAVLAAAGLGVYLWISQGDRRRSDGSSRDTFGSRLAEATGSVSDAISDLDRLFGGAR